MKIKYQGDIVVDNKKTILKTILFTLLVLVASLVVLVLLMFFFFTKNFADFMYDLGCDRLASSMYYRVYQKSDKIIYCHKALNIRISLGDDEKVIEYYKAFECDDEYEDFLDACDKNSESLNISILEKSAILNEKNYLINNYVKSLVREGDIEEAWNIALENFENYNSLDIDEQGVYAFGEFVKAESWENFNIEDSQGKTILEKMQEYFDYSTEIFEANKNTENNIEEAYLVALGNRIINVGQDINAIYNGLELNQDKVSINIDKMVAINNIIK